MPRYQFHHLPDAGGDLHPVEDLFFSDAAAIRRAIGSDFPQGCDLWQGNRYVGRFHCASVPQAAPDS
jgi:hypothetical protein